MLDEVPAVGRRGGGRKRKKRGRGTSRGPQMALRLEDCSFGFKQTSRTDRGQEKRKGK